ncbi:hypothetical protein Tco_0697100 [Tanacetum coccineum]
MRELEKMSADADIKRSEFDWCHVSLCAMNFGMRIKTITAVVTAETGLLKKLTFLQTNGVVLKRCSESMIVNGLGLGLATLCGLVILTTVSPKQYQSIPTTKIPYNFAFFPNSLPLPHLVLKDGMLMRIWQLVLIVGAVTADTRTVGEALASSKRGEWSYPSPTGSLALASALFLSSML